MTKLMIDMYFTRLDVHRPVFIRSEFVSTLDALYDGHAVQHDPGYVCGLYLVLALGTMCELNKKAVDINEGPDGSSDITKLLPKGWPEHDEFFERALAVKPDLRVTISSLQALVLLQWYLYTEVMNSPLHRVTTNIFLTATRSFTLASGGKPCPPRHRVGVAS